MLSEASEVLHTLALSLTAASLRVTFSEDLKGGGADSGGAGQGVGMVASQRASNYVVVFNHTCVTMLIND